MKRIALASLVLLGGFASLARAADTVYYYYNDAQGSPVAVTDAHGTVVERTQYAPYGQVLNRPEHDGPGYTKHEEDAATGLTNMQQRYDDKVIGRMLSMDPMDVDSTTGANFNRYAYAADNPYRYVDPDGRQTTLDCGANGCFPAGKSGFGAMADLVAEANMAVSASQPAQQQPQPQPKRSSGSARSSDDMRVTDNERRLAQAGNVEGYYRARESQGDPIAAIGLDSIHPHGGVMDYLFGGESVNNRLEAFSRVYTGHSINLSAVRIDLMNAQIRAIDADKTGVVGLLSPGQVYDYHIAVFRNYGLPSTSFGGTPFTGERWEAYLTAPIWCRGCDK